MQREASDVKAPARQEVWQVRRCRAHCRAIRSGAPGSFRTPKTRNGIVTGPVPGAPMRLFGARRTRGDRQPSGVLVAEIGPVPSRPAGGCVRRASRAPASPGLRRALEPSQQTAAFALIRWCRVGERDRRVCLALRSATRGWAGAADARAAARGGSPAKGYAARPTGDAPATPDVQADQPAPRPSPRQTKVQRDREALW